MVIFHSFFCMFTRPGRSFAGFFMGWSHGSNGDMKVPGMALEQKWCCLALNWSHSDYSAWLEWDGKIRGTNSGWLEWDADAKKGMHRDMGQNELTMWYLALSEDRGSYPTKNRIHGRTWWLTVFLFGGCLIFRHSHSSSPKNDGCPKHARKTTTNDVILGTCWAWHVFFWQVSSFLQHLTKQVSWTTVWNSCWLFCGMAVWLFRVSFELGSGPGNWGQQLGVPVLQMGVTPQYVMSTPDQRPVWSTEKPGGLLMGLSKTRVLSRRFAGE